MKLQDKRNLSMRISHLSSVSIVCPLPMTMRGGGSRISCSSIDRYPTYQYTNDVF